MSDLYYELLVKKDRTMKDVLIKFGLIGVTVIVVLIGLMFSPILLLVAVALGFACYFIIPKTDVEYEYLFVNGELDVDMVMSKSRRKRVKSIMIPEADLVAPLNSHRLDYYNGNQKMKVIDYSSGNKEHRRFAVITRDQNDSCKIIIEPDERMEQMIKNSAPGKVFLD